MLDDLLESFVGGVVRALGYIFIEILFEFVFYYIGYPIVKIVTFGKYPVKDDSTFLQSETHHGFYVSAVGLIFTIIIVVACFIIINSKGIS